MASLTTITDFAALKSADRKISMLTAYDYGLARILDESGVDGILVGDTVGVVVQGHANTLPVTLDQIIYHAEMVGRAVERALVVVDLPFASYQVGIHEAIAAAARVLKETACPAVKLEGGAEQSETIDALVKAGIPVMAHVGLRPQSIHQLGGYRVQRDEQKLLEDAQAAQQAGAFAVVLECIPAAIAQQLTESLEIPTIGIGAGSGCDGQVLVTHDMLGMTEGHVPKFVRPYAGLRESMSQAVQQYCQDVQSGNFPGPEQSYE
jgi:3-methyl-2-oxobutanoate hydroxymethyltransferase